MEWIDQPAIMRQRARALAQAGTPPVLVPTLGYLHEGHRRQIELARELEGPVVVSIFLDPEEFGPNEDYQRYPRDLEHDRRVCESMGVDVVFAPSVEAMYPKGHSTQLEERRVSSGLCGVSRPYHFRAATTTFLKLIHMMYPRAAVLSRHEIQRVAVIQRVVRDLLIDIEIHVAPLAREADGLACDARNVILPTELRKEAAGIYASLQSGKKVYDQGNHSIDRIEAEVINTLRESRRLHVLYATVVKADTMEVAREIIPGATLLRTAVLVDQIRLIDHIEFD